MTRTILCVCGGTGGHIYPALAIADAMKKQGWENIVFAGRLGSMEEKLVAPLWPFEPITAVPLKRGSIIENLGLPVKLLRSLSQSLSLIKRIKPIAVVATGGYVSLPVILAAGLKKVPVYIQEQNAVAGIANRIGSRFATKIFVTSTEAAKMFSKVATEIFGNPVRALPAAGSMDLPQEFANAKYKVLVLGGSQGARGINIKMSNALSKIASQPEYSVVWQAGAKNIEDIRRNHSIPANVHIKGFLENVYAYIDAADLIVSRAGASTLAELLAFGKASILMPFPFATANHQEHNARVVEKAGAALVELDSDPDGLWDKVCTLMNNSELRSTMSQKALALGMPNAADRIAQRILMEVES